MQRLVFRIVTQPCRSAGTTAGVRVHYLMDTAGKRLGPFPWIRDADFAANSTVLQQINVHSGVLDSTSLQELCIGHDSVGDAGTGWLLAGVGVGVWEEGTITPLKETWFPHITNAWLGESDAFDGRSGPPHVTLQAENVTAAQEQRQRVKLTSMETGAFAIPEAMKMKRLGKRGRITKREGWAGEDAYFINPESYSFGVADGVSQWAERGIDAGLFARELIRGASQEPNLEHAFQFAKKSGLRGSSTLVICRLDMENAKCYCETIGDSQVMLVQSDGKVLKRSVAQEHSFGTPFQLDSDENRDRPKDGLKFVWDVAPGDFLVAGSDGLFDNMGEDEIALRVAAAAEDDKRTCSQRAVDLATRAFELSQDKRGSSPYSKAASEALNLAFSGGKGDDITVIVSRVM